MEANWTDYRADQSDFTVFTAWCEASSSLPAGFRVCCLLSKHAAELLSPVSWTPWWWRRVRGRWASAAAPRTASCWDGRTPSAGASPSGSRPYWAAPCGRSTRPSPPAGGHRGRQGQRSSDRNTEDHSQYERHLEVQFVLLLSKQKQQLSHRVKNSSVRFNSHCRREKNKRAQIFKSSCQTNRSAKSLFIQQLFQEMTVPENLVLGTYFLLKSELWPLCKLIKKITFKAETLQLFSWVTVSCKSMQTASESRLTSPDWRVLILPSVALATGQLLLLAMLYYLCEPHPVCYSFKINDKRLIF